MRTALTEAGGLDPKPGDRTSEGDGAQLGNAHGHQSMRQGRFDEMFVRRHAQHIGCSGVGVDAQDAIEGGNVQAGRACGGPWAEQVRGALGQPHGRALGDACVLLCYPGNQEFISWVSCGLQHEKPR